MKRHFIFICYGILFKNGSTEIRVGKRTIAAEYGKGSRGDKTNYAHISKLLNGLEQRGCISIGDTNRDGTLYTIFLPNEINSVIEKMSMKEVTVEEDYFNDPGKRKEIFERDGYICQYCGEKVTQENVTLDHYVPQSKGGKHTKENLKTCCLLCNGIKSGKTYEEPSTSGRQSPLFLVSLKFEFLSWNIKNPLSWYILAGLW